VSTRSRTRRSPGTPRAHPSGGRSGRSGRRCPPAPGSAPAQLPALLEDEGRPYVNPEDLGFEGISPDVASYDIGGHPVLRRWLRSRCGRVLLPAEILTFRRIASALTFTLEVLAIRLAPLG
jgi:hypothetical protein